MKEPTNRVLVVDDEPNIRNLLTEALASEGIEVRTIGNGLEARDVLSHDRFDVVVLDVRLPGMDGLSLSRWIRDAGLDSDIVIITAYSSVDTAVASVRIGVSDYLLKPFGAKDLVRAVKAIIERRGSGEEDPKQSLRLPAARNERSARVRGMEGLLRTVDRIAHNLNNALAAVVGYSSILRGTEKPSDELPQFAARVETSAAYSSELVEKMLEFTRMVNCWNPVRMSVRDLVRDYVTAIRDRYKDTAISADPDATLPDVIADRRQIHRLVDNLVRNAVEAIGTKGRIIVTARAADVDDALCHEHGIRAGRYVTISVKDNGPGIPTKDIGSAFCPFHTTKEGHFGLGLPMVEAIAGLSYGAVTASSTTNGGTTITVYLPAADD